jgi:NADH dehydrogenase
VVWIAAMIFDRFKWFPATRDQLQDLVNGNTCNSNEIFKKYEIDPIPFNVSNLNYLNK